MFLLSAAFLVLAIFLAERVGYTTSIQSASKPSPSYSQESDDQELNDDQREKIRILTDMIRSSTSLECRAAIETAMSDGSDIPESCKEEVMEIYRKLSEDGQGADGFDTTQDSNPDNMNSNNNKQDLPVQLNKPSGISALTSIIIFVVATILCIIFICYKNRDMIYAPRQKPPKEKDNKKQKVLRR